MIEVNGKVMKVEAGFAWIRREEGQMCSQCDLMTGCKSMAITQLFCNKEATFRVRDPLGVAIGEKVRVAIAEKALLAGAVAGYGIPVLSLIIGALLGIYLGEESLSILGGSVGFLGAIIWLRKKKIPAENMPTIVQDAPM